MIPTNVKTKFDIALDVLSNKAAIKTKNGNTMTIDNMTVGETR